MKRVFLIVLDSCGIGEEPDAAQFGDVGSNTLRSCAASPEFNMDNLIAAGLGRMDGVDYLPQSEHPTAAVARLRELSRGKDTTIGHWEISGIVSENPLPTYPHGFPEEVLAPFREATGRGMTDFTYTAGNTDGLAKTMELAGRDFEGLCFVNLVDFDMLYGHRRDPDGYARALHEFDMWLPEFLKKLGEDDLVMITADHGCDPRFMKHTDHTREYVPLIALGRRVKPVNLGTRDGFCDIAATVAELLDVPYRTQGHSFAADILR